MRKSKSHLPQLGFLIYDIGRLLRASWIEHAQDLEMTEAQWRTIAHLTRMEGCRQTDLAQTLQIRPITLARVIDKLESAGLVQRKRHETDRRAFTLHLTREAAPFIATLSKRGDTLNKRAVRDVSPAQMEQLLKLLERIRGNLADGRNGKVQRGRSHEG
jgi:MarR family transcriptional regulator, transcriptional regulator for hemolysin